MDIHKLEDIVECQFDTFDNFIQLEKIKSVDFIKCNLAGAELLFLKGAINTLTRLYPVVMIKIIEEWCQKFDYSGQLILDFMNKNGYSCYLVCNGKLKLIESFSTEDNNGSSFLFIHSTRYEEILELFE